MGTLVQSPEDIELNLLTQWGDPDSPTRTRKAAIYSVLAHAGVILILAVLPAPGPHRPEVTEVHRIITPLIEPPTELTQKDPNTGKISKEFSVASEPRPHIQAPPALPSTSKRPQPLASVPSVPAPKPTPAVPLPEPPKVESATKDAPPSILPPSPVAPPPPQIRAEEKPRIAFENVAPAPPPPTPGKSNVPMPGNTVADAVRQVIRGNTSGTGMVVSDSDSPGQAGYGSGINLPTTPGSPANQLQLLTDPQGVDFKPYLIRVLASVKQHWQAVIPESVRMGRSGKVALQFSIARDGHVPKLVIASPSGANELDRAAVAGVSASVPCPPLPSDFKGDTIVLQFNFAYNTKR